MRVAISGSHGLIGSAVIAELNGQGCEVVRLVRGGPNARNEIGWDPGSGTIQVSALEGFDAIIHLAGENIASGRWTEEVKAKIRSSRIKGTETLANAILKLKNPPKSFFCASAIGYYGDRDGEELTESSPPGRSFLATLCQDWENVASSASSNGVRVVNLRIGVVLSKDGGALAKMRLPFEMGVGGQIGTGRQYMSWIAIDDVAGAVCHLLNIEISGPLNIVAPFAVSNLQFTKTLGKVLNRPTLLPMPEFAAKLAFGEMAEELLLSSAKVKPQKLLGTGFRYSYSDLEKALRHVLGKD